MRLAQHLFYAVAALVGVGLMVLSDPALPVALAAVDGPATACSSEHLERPCDPGIQVAGVMRDGRVVAR